MTIQAAPSEQAYATDGIATIFPIPFPFDTAADLKLTSTDASGNILTLATGFTISGGAGSTGNATFSVAPAAGLTITIYDDPARTQPTDYVSLDAFPAESHERALDRVTRIAKRLYQIVQRSLQFPDGDVSTNGVLGSVANRKGKYLFFNAVTGAIEYAANIVTTALSQSIIGALLNPQTDAEIATGITPINFFRSAGNILRYGTNTTPGTTDMTTAIANCLTVCGRSGDTCFIPAGTYKITADLTPAVGVTFLNSTPFAVDIKGAGREQTILQFTAGTNGVYFNGVSGFKLCGKISDLTIDGTTALPTALTFANCDMPRAENLLIRRCTGRGAFYNSTLMGTFREVYMTACGSAGQAALEILNSTTFNWDHSYLSNNNAACVAGVRVDKSSRSDFFKGAIESSGIPMQIGSLADAVTGCVGGTIIGVDFEKPNDHYLEFGYGLSAGAVIQGWHVRGCSGFPSGAAAVPYAVKLNACTAIRFGENNWSQNGSPTATYWLEGLTNSGVVIEAHPQLYGYAWPWVKQNGAQIVSATPLVDFTQKDVTAAGAVPNVTTLTGATPTLSVNTTQGGVYARGRFFNAGPVTVTTLGGGVGAAGGAGLGQLFIGQSTNGNTTLTHAPATPGAFNLPGGQNFLMPANVWYVFVGDGTAWCLASLVTGLTQITGWGTPTGAVVQNNYAGATATLPQTSAAVAEIITVLKNLGLFGA